LIDQIKCCPDRADGGDAGWRTALDHDHFDAECAGRGDLAIRGAAAGILGHDDVDVLVGQQFSFICLAKGTAREDVAAVGSGKRRIDRVDTPDEIAVLWRGRETASLLAADGEEDATRPGSERGDGRIDVVDADPDVAVNGLPCRTAQREERNSRSLSSCGRIGGYLVGERMGGVNEQANAFLSQVINQTLGAAETADARRQGQGLWIGGATGQRNRGLDIATPRQLFGQAARFGRAAQDQDTVLGHG